MIYVYHIGVRPGIQSGVTGAVMAVLGSLVRRTKNEERFFFCLLILVVGGGA
jgi:hypothetical protein